MRNPLLHSHVSTFCTLLLCVGSSFVLVNKSSLLGFFACAAVSVLVNKSATIHMCSQYYWGHELLKDKYGTRNPAWPSCAKFLSPPLRFLVSWCRRVCLNMNIPTHTTSCFALGFPPLSLVLPIPVGCAVLPANNRQQVSHPSLRAVHSLPLTCGEEEPGETNASKHRKPDAVLTHSRNLDGGCCSLTPGRLVEAAFS